MKIIKYLSLILAVTLMASCEKEVIEYDTSLVGAMAEFQLHYMVPVTTAAANNITKVLINGQLYSNDKSPLATYNAIPSGAAGRFYAVQPGAVNIKMYQGTKMDQLVYDQNTTLKAGKQNVFVHAFNQAPVVIDNGYPYIRRQTVGTDTITFIKFYNFLYETDGVPTTLKLQYQYQSHRTSEWVNVGPPVAFGEATGWQPVLVLKIQDGTITDGNRRVDYKILVVDDSGAIIGDLMIMKTNGDYTVYSDYWTGYVGRRAHHIMSGYRAVKAPNSAVRNFWAL